MIDSFRNQYNMYKNETKMAYLEIENGIILPRIMVDDGLMWGAGGVCDKNNNFIKSSEYHGGWAEHGGFYEWDKEEYREEEVVYFGVFFQHWGHFLVDLIGRLWYFTQRNIGTDVKLAYLGEEEPSGNYLEFFELLGIGQDRLIHIKKPTRFKKVIVPEFSCRTCIWYTNEFQSIFDSIVARAEKEKTIIEEIPAGAKVYFSRLTFGKAQKSEFGEKLLGEWLAKNGYLIVSPEKLGLREQIYVWNHASEIICLNGSIPINVAFSCNPYLKLTVMNKTSLPHKNLELFLLMRSCKAEFIDVYQEPFKGYPKSLGEGPFLLCICDDVRKYSEKRGMSLPVSESAIKKDYFCNYWRAVWSIINIKKILKGIWWRVRKRMKK